MGYRTRVTVTFTVTTEELLGVPHILNGCAGAVQGAWPGVDGYIEPNSHFSMVQVGSSRVPAKKVAKKRARAR